jgi:hypothetical protein
MAEQLAYYKSEMPMDNTNYNIERKNKSISVAAKDDQSKTLDFRIDKASHTHQSSLSKSSYLSRFIPK